MGKKCTQKFLETNTSQVLGYCGSFSHPYFGGFSKKEEYSPCGHDSNSRKDHGREMQGEAQGDLHRRLARAGRRHPCQGHCIDHLGGLDIKNGQD